MNEVQVRTVDEYCEGCKYYTEVFSDLHYCSYYFKEDKRRPCPAGKGCTAKVKGKPRKGYWVTEDG